jgi:hypothetical protein
MAEQGRPRWGGAGRCLTGQARAIPGAGAKALLQGGEVHPASGPDHGSGRPLTHPERDRMGKGTDKNGLYASVDSFELCRGGSSSPQWAQPVPKALFPLRSNQLSGVRFAAGCRVRPRTSQSSAGPGPDLVFDDAPIGVKSAFGGLGLLCLAVLR